jgi:hypothetical protein
MNEEDEKCKQNFVGKSEMKTRLGRRRRRQRIILKRALYKRDIDWIYSFRTVTSGSLIQPPATSSILSLCLTKHHPMKTYWGSGGIAPLIL